MRTWIAAACAASALFSGAGGSIAQTFPARNITWVNPSAAGGPTDKLGRMISEPMGQLLGQTIVTENVAGAGGIIGSGKAARALPDGYTYLVGHVGYMAAAPSLYKKLTYDPVKDFEAVFRMPNLPGVIVATPNAPFKNFAQLIEYAKKNPGKLNVADGGVGTMSNLVVSMLTSRAGIEVTQISHKGNAPALLAVLGGHADLMIEPPNTAMPHVRSGKLVALATTSIQPLDYLPNVPTVAQHYPGFDGTVWFGLYAPKGTPRPIIDRMYQAYLATMKEPALQKSMIEQGMQLLPDALTTPDALQQHTIAEVDKYREVIRAARIEPQ